MLAFFPLSSPARLAAFVSRWRSCAEDRQARQHRQALRGHDDGEQERDLRAGGRGGSVTAFAEGQRVALTKPEAAAALGMSIDSFDRHVAPEIRIIRRGKLRLIPVAELVRWAAAAAERTI